jgi:hypothetical protein
MLMDMLMGMLMDMLMGMLMDMLMGILMDMLMLMIIAGAGTGSTGSVLLPILFMSWRVR